MGKRPKTKMSMEDRAKQFQPFSTIGPLSAALLKKEKEHEEKVKENKEKVCEEP